MPYIIWPTQTGIIQGRITTENIILTSEILSKFNNQGKSKFLCAKIDIGKAFDKVCRSYLL